MKTRKQSQPTKKTRRTVIPLHIYQVWHDFKDMPSSVKESIETLKEQNPEFEHHLYDEAMCRTYLKNNFPKRVVQAFDKVVPYALKADIWRYCILYKKGGIYLDSKYYGIDGFKLITLTDKEYFCGVKHDDNSGIYNAFMICKPGNKKLLQSIKQFVKNTEENYYGHKALCVGPLMMESFFTKKELIFELEYEFITFQKQYIEFHGKRILQRHPLYHDQKKNRWMDAWKDRTLYHYQSRIPSIFFQTSKKKPLKYVVDQIKEKTKGWKYMHFTDKDILQFFKEHTLKEFPNIEEKFNSFEKGPHKADLFRYYFLYVKGGVFMDSDAMLEVDIGTIVKEHDFFSVDSKYISPRRVFQGFIGCVPKHPILYAALKDMYAITNKDLKDYTILTKHMYRFYQTHKTPLSTLYFEKYITKPNKTLTNPCKSVTYEEDRLLLTHYPCQEKIPHIV
jgi:mannosyltransferase OCH1-like enzyme